VAASATPNTIRTRRLPFRAREELDVWPNGAKMAVLVYTAPEEWIWSGPEVLPTPGTFTVPAEKTPSLSSRSAVAFGYNIGLYRLAEIFARYDMHVTLWTNGASVEQHPQTLRDLVDAGHDLGAHGYSEGAVISTLTRDEQRDSISRTVDLIGGLTGQPPRGWIGPGAVCTADTVDLLSQAGFEYHADMQDDEVPYFISVNQGPEMVEIPYRMVGNVNDFPLFLRNIQSIKTGVEHLKQTFDAYYAEAQRRPLIFNYGTHPFVSGRPDFARVLDEFLQYVHSFDDIWVANYAEIANWWRKGFSDHEKLVSSSITA
jgi:allantoinase